MSDRSSIIPNEVTMLTRLLSILILLGLTFFASAAGAATPGPYLTLEGYGTRLDESDNQTDTGIFNATYDGGIGGGVALGYDLAGAYPSLGRGRVELEVASRKSTVDKLVFVEGTIPASGELTVNSIMVQTIADYHGNSRLAPYLSIGVGYAEVSIDQISFAGEPIIAASSDAILAGQLGAGFGIKLGDHLTVDMGYRYFATRKPNFKQADGSNFTSEMVSHNLLVGLRFKY